ncbi:N-acetylglucosamine-6-phosphate deacetylase [Rossellomorea marisflavi]|uniref:N-acetylglucosamine-6-phosphate deacetylase n=1 Tax=Rossellomorea marisflavi TaxID=189381 RepID=A0A161RP34_9BACI|nr:N-acetylglucosamine-6-phosphate deacetylase [Rossellomorea marisflavi]KZE48028.1 N-acetylglucosamine-6-phosphate deacetylase [Rossellomorea marisflavi]
MNSKPIILLGGTIYGEDGVIQEGYMKIEDGSISSMGSKQELHSMEGCEVVQVPTEYSIIPGLIDVHIHGANGSDTMDATKESLDVMTAILPAEGTTSFLATTITEKRAVIEDALKNVRDYMERHQHAGQAEILGIHLEGPFINPGRAGAQPVQSILKPDLEAFMKWEQLSGGTIKLVTLAPELDGDHALISYLRNKGIVASAGHTSATYEQMENAIDAGLSHVTHLFNQMSGLHHREPGVVGAAFARPELMVELIADGVHVKPEVVNIAYRQVTDERFILITDSMRAKCLKNGQYDLGGQMVTVKDGVALLDPDTLAGSVLKMNHAFTNVQDFTGAGLENAIRMASENPARQLGVFDRKGSLKAGKDADIVIMDAAQKIMATYCNGTLAYERKEDSHETD